MNQSIGQKVPAMLSNLIQNCADIENYLEKMKAEIRIFLTPIINYQNFCNQLTQCSLSIDKLQLIYNRLSADNFIHLLMICNFINDAQIFAPKIITDPFIQQLIAGIKRDSNNRNYLDLDLFPNNVRFAENDDNGNPIKADALSNAYPMDGPERGIFYIVVNVPTIGTLRQMLEFGHIYSAVKFKVIFRINMNKQELMNELKELLPETGDTHSAFGLYYLGHASTNAIDCFDTKLLYKDIFDLIKSSQLYKERKSITLAFDCCRIRDIAFTLNQNTVPNMFGGSVNPNANQGPQLFAKVELPQLKGVLIVHSVQDCSKADFTFTDGTLFGRNFAQQLKKGALYRDIEDTLDKTSAGMENELMNELLSEYPINYPNRDSEIERQFELQYKPIQVIKDGVKRRLFIGRDIVWDQTSKGYIIKLQSNS